MVIMVKKIIGTSSISGQFKTTIIKKVADTLELNSGDTIVYYEEDGRIYIEKA